MSQEKWTIADLNCAPGFRKEQRLDGSWQVSGVSCLRYSLTGLKINYKVKIPSLLRNKFRFYSSMTEEKPHKYILNPRWVTGFCDGESSFTIYIYRQDCLTG